ncbi:MAG: efflux RND transporter periplasmic adaptor subunit [Minisyncoccia bacterium]
MKFSKKQIIWSSVILLVIILGYFAFSGKKNVATPNTTTIKKGNVIQEVSVTGRVKPTTVVDLGFEKSGRINGVYARVGDHVENGQTLAEVDGSSAEGNLAEATARLAELKRGPRPEELAVKKAELAKYTQDLDNAVSGTSDLFNDVFAKADDALHTKTTGIFSGYKNSSYTYTFSICDSRLAIEGEGLRLATETDFDLWRTERERASITPSKTEQGAMLVLVGKHLETILTFLGSLSHTLSLDCTAGNTTLDGYRANINSARTNVTLALANVNAKKQSITTLTLALAKVQDELALMSAGEAVEVLTAQEARVRSAQSELAKYRIVSPITGVVTKGAVTQGEGAMIGVKVFSVISDTSFEIEAYIPEADIAKIKLGDSARITLDAYGSDVFFPGVVTAIDPAETIIDNVPTYKTTFHFTQNDPRIKSGMTANIDVSTASRTNVLFAPERALITRGGNKFIRTVSPDGSTSDVAVTVGLKGSDGTIEILTGTSEGTAIIMAPQD